MGKCNESDNREKVNKISINTFDSLTLHNLGYISIT